MVQPEFIPPMATQKGWKGSEMDIRAPVFRPTGLSQRHLPGTAAEPGRREHLDLICNELACSDASLALIFRALIDSADRPVSKSRLAAVSGKTVVAIPRSMCRLRGLLKRFGIDGCLQTILGAGYIFDLRELSSCYVVEHPRTANGSGESPARRAA